MQFQVFNFPILHSHAFTNGNNILAGTALNISHSTNNGDSWQSASSGLPKLAVKSLGAIYSTVFAGTLGYYSFVTNDQGGQWSQDRKGLTQKNVNALLGRDLLEFAGTDANAKQGIGGVHRSTDWRRRSREVRPSR